MASRFLSRSDSGGSKASADDADVGAGPEALVAERAEAVRVVLETVMRPPAAKKYPNNIREWLVRTSPGQKRAGAQLQTPPKAKQPGKHGRAAAAAASSHPEKEQQSEDTSTKHKTQKQLAAAKKLSNRTGTVDDGPESKVDAEEEEGDEEEPAEGGEEEEEEAKEAAEEETQEEDEEEEADEDNEEEEAKSAAEFAKFRDAISEGKARLPTTAATPAGKKKTDHPATTTPMKAKKKAMPKAMCSKSMKMCKSPKTKASKCKSKAMKQSKQSSTTKKKQQSDKDTKKKSAMVGRKKKANALARTYAARGTRGTFAGRRPPANKAMLAHFNYMKQAYACAQRLVKEEKTKGIRISQGDFVDAFTSIWDELVNDTNVKPENRVQLTAVAYIKMCVDKKQTSPRSKV